MLDSEAINSIALIFFLFLKIDEAVFHGSHTHERPGDRASLAGYAATLSREGRVVLQKRLAKI